MKLLPILSVAFFLALFSESCNQSKKVPQEGDSDFPSELIVLLTPISEAGQLEKEFSVYEFKSQSRVSRSQKKFLFTFNKSLISPEEMIKKVLASPIVLEAEFPKKVNDN